MVHAIIEGPFPTCLEGRQGALYRLRRPCAITGHQESDEALSTFPLAVFQPPGRDPAHTPLLIGLQGMAAPYQWNGFVVPTLLDMGIACALFDTPLAGERSLVRDRPGDVIRQLVALLERGITLTAGMVAALMEVVAGDIAAVPDLLRERHGLRDERIALFGVSLGCLLVSLAFSRDGVGGRLLGVLGHADLALFARSYAPPLTPLLASLPGRWLGKALCPWLGTSGGAVLSFLGVLHELRDQRGGCSSANPVTHAGRVSGSRRVRFLVGREDRLVRPHDAQRCARLFGDGECYIVPGLAHGPTHFGPSFVDHVRYFLGTQLGDWRS
jgi:hypothetical protein